MSPANADEAVLTGELTIRGITGTVVTSAELAPGFADMDARGSKDLRTLRKLLNKLIPK